MSMQGFMRGKRFGIESKSFRIELPLPLVLMARCKMLTSELCEASCVNDGIFDASFATNSSLVSFSNAALISRNRLILSWNWGPLKEASCSFLLKMYSAQDRYKPFL